MTQNANFPDFWNFCGKSGCVTFLTLWSPKFMQKIRKIVRAVSEKNGYQLLITNYYSIDFMGPVGQSPHMFNGQYSKIRQFRASYGRYGKL